MWMEKVSPGPASSVGTETDPLPAASCALTISVMLRMRFWPELRRDSAVLTSMRFAPPRAVVTGGLKSVVSELTGESLGKLILIPWPLAQSPLQTNTVAATGSVLLNICRRNRNLPCVLVHVTRAGRALRAYRIHHRLQTALIDPHPPAVFNQHHSRGRRSHHRTTLFLGSAHASSGRHVAD